MKCLLIHVFRIDQCPWDKKTEMTGTSSFSVGKATAAVCGKCLNISLVSKLEFFFRYILKQIYLNVFLPVFVFFFFLQCISVWNGK